MTTRHDFVSSAVDDIRLCHRGPNSCERREDFTSGSSGKCRFDHPFQSQGRASPTLRTCLKPSLAIMSGSARRVVAKVGLLTDRHRSTLTANLYRERHSRRRPYTVSTYLTIALSFRAYRRKVYSIGKGHGAVHVPHPPCLLRSPDLLLISPDPPSDLNGSLGQSHASARTS